MNNYSPIQFHEVQYDRELPHGITYSAWQPYGIEWREVYAPWRDGYGWMWCPVDDE